MTHHTSSRLLALILVGSAALAVTAAPAMAQQPNPDEMLARADANGDGNISMDEAMALRAQSFAQLDRNGDGVISGDDRPRGPFAARFDQAFEQVEANFDGDRDGQVTEDEMMSAPAPAFERGDLDGDGVLTAEEMAALRAEASPH